MNPNLWGREPVTILAVVQAGLALLVGFGFKLTGEQVALIMAFSAALLGLLVRQQVRPVALLPDALQAELKAKKGP